MLARCVLIISVFGLRRSILSTLVKLDTAFLCNFLAKLLIFGQL